MPRPNLPSRPVPVFALLDLVTGLVVGLVFSTVLAVGVAFVCSGFYDSTGVLVVSPGVGLEVKDLFSAA